jgi:BlaI family transcriptional regulator, penicillinase repressor
VANSNEKLSRREREIMNAIHALDGRASAEDIRQQLTDPPSYSAVRAMLAKLEAKGQLRHEAEGLKYVYVPTASRSTAQKKALHQLMEVFFRGSPASAITALLKEEKWSADELKELRAQIDRLQIERRKK